MVGEVSVMTVIWRLKAVLRLDEAKSEIHVVDFWDMRQDPESLVEGLAEE